MRMHYHMVQFPGDVTYDRSDCSIENCQFGLANPVELGKYFAGNMETEFLEWLAEEKKLSVGEGIPVKPWHEARPGGANNVFEHPFEIKTINTPKTVPLVTAKINGEYISIIECQMVDKGKDGVSITMDIPDDSPLAKLMRNNLGLYTIGGS